MNARGKLAAMLLFGLAILASACHSDGGTTWAGSKREMTMDRAQNLYREIVELFDGSTLKSTASLSDHRD
jgi:hypothetical protein